MFTLNTSDEPNRFVPELDMSINDWLFWFTGASIGTIGVRLSEIGFIFVGKPEEVINFLRVSIEAKRFLPDTNKMMEKLYHFPAAPMFKNEMAQVLDIIMDSMWPRELEVGRNDGN